MPRISRDQLIELQKGLRTDAAIGRKIKITPQAVHLLRKKHGIDSRLKNNPARNAKIIDRYKTGFTGPSIAKEFDLSATHLYRILNSAGIGIRKRGPAKKRKK